MSAKDMHATIELLEAVFSVWSMSRPYNKSHLLLEESLERAVRRIRGWCGMAASLGVSVVSWLLND
jgi:hypothetical protein